MLFWEFGRKKTFAIFQAGFWHQLEAPTVWALHTHRENTAGCVLPGNPLENVWPSLKSWHCFQCHLSIIFSLFLGKNSGVKKEVCKGGGTVSKILVTVQLLKPDVKRRSLTLSLNCSVNDFAWWWLLSISVSLSIHWQFLSMWGWALQEVGNVTLHFGLESVLVITSFY